MSTCDRCGNNIRTSHRKGKSTCHSCCEQTDTDPPDVDGDDDMMENIIR